jgi:hypothetical protein
MKEVTAMTAIDNVLAAAVASYAKAAVVTVTETKLVKIQSAKKAKAPKAVKTPSPNGATALVATVKGEPSQPMPPVGTLEAKGFLMMIRRAKSLNEKISAIQAYIGYNPSESFASQELNATRKAQLELKPLVVTGQTRQERFEAARSVAGYVAGMPQPQQKVLADLLAREKNAAEERDNHAKLARNDALSQEERKNHAGMAALEHKRMLQIRKDIAAL